MFALSPAAADRLMDLTSRDGDWFLDELCSMSGNVNHLLGVLSDPAVCQLLPADMCQNISTAMQSCHTVYMSLQVCAKLHILNSLFYVSPDTVFYLMKGEEN